MSRRTRRQVLASLGAGAAAGLAGCSDDADLFESTATATQATLSADVRYGYTHLRPSGNRVLAGVGNVRDVDPVTFETAVGPMWVTALPAETGSYWTLVETLGSARTVHVADGTASVVAEHRSLPAGVPPLTRRRGDGVGLVRPPGDAAPRTHPVVTEAGLLYVAEAGDLVLRGADGDERWGVGALPDGRIVHVEGSRYALLGDRTARYDHGALGDETEGGSLVMFDAAVPEVTVRREVGPPAVVEGVAPLAADVDGDGTPEVVLTVADGTDGARIAVYGQDGTELATGPADGPGWRHRLAVAPFADGRQELAATRRPHVDQVVEFYRLEGDSLSVVAEMPNVESHTYGRYAVDGALAGDVDDDGTVELLAPLVGRDSLLAIERTDDGAAVDWQYYLDSPLTSNLTGVSLPDGRVAVGAGTEDGLVVWQG